MQESRTPKCITQRNSQIISNNTLSPYLRNVIINEQQLNQHLDSLPFDASTKNQANPQQLQFNQQNFSGGNFISSQPQYQLYQNNNNNNTYNSNSRNYAQQQQNYRSVQINKNTTEFNCANKNDNHFDYQNQNQIGNNIHTATTNDNSQIDMNYNTSNSNNHSNNFHPQNYNTQNNKYHNNDGSNNYQVHTSQNSISQMSGDFSQQGVPSENNYNQSIQQQVQYPNPIKMQKEIRNTPLQNIEQENLLSQMSEKIKFLTTENEEQKKKLRNINQQFIKTGKNDPSHLYEKLHTISNQIQSLSNSQLKLDLRKLNTESSSQFKIDSSRSYGRSQLAKSDLVQSPREQNQNEIEEENGKKQKKKYQNKRHKSKNHHHHKKRRDSDSSSSSSNSSITSSSDSGSSSSSSCSSSSSSSDDDSNKHHKKRHTHKKSKYSDHLIKSSQIRYEEIQNEKAYINRSASKRDNKKSRNRKKENTHDEIFKFGSQLIKEVNVSRKLRDLFMQTIGSTEQFRRMLVEKKYKKAFLGIIKVFLDILTIINFNKKSSSPTHSPVSYSPMSHLINTSTMTTHSNLTRNPVLSQSRYLPSQIHIKNIDYQQQQGFNSQINQSLSSPTGTGYIPPYVTDRIYNQNSGSHSPITSHSFVSVKQQQGSYYVPGQSQKRPGSPHQLGNQILNNSTNHYIQNQYYQMPRQIAQNQQGGVQNNIQNGIISGQSYDLNLSNINPKSQNNIQNSLPPTGQTSGSDTYRQNFDSFMQPSPSGIKNKQITQNDLQKYVQSPYFNQGNSSAKKKQEKEGIRIQQHYMKKLDQGDDWNEDNQEENEYESYQRARTPRSASNNNNNNRINKENQNKNHNYQTLNNKNYFESQNNINSHDDESDFQQKYIQSKVSSIQSQNSQQASSYNHSHSTHQTHQLANKSSTQNTRSHSPSPNLTQVNQQKIKEEKNSQKQQKQPNYKSTKQDNNQFNNLTIENEHKKTMQHLISPKVVNSPTKNRLAYQISSSVPEIEMDSDSQQASKIEQNFKTMKKSQKDTKSDNQMISTKNKSQNRSFVFDDDSISTHSATNNNRKQVGFTPKQNLRDKKTSLSPVVGLMPCMKIRASNNGTITPSKNNGSSTNLKSDLSARGSHNNLDSKCNSVYSYKNQPVGEQQLKSSKAPPVSIEFVGAKKKFVPDFKNTRDFDIISGYSIQQKSLSQNKLEVPQIKIVDADSTPNSKNESKSFGDKTPSLRNEKEEIKQMN